MKLLRPNLTIATNTSLLNEIKKVPIVDCHEHQVLVPDYPDPRFPGAGYGFPVEPIAFLLRGYFVDDLLSSGATEEDVKILKGSDLSTKEKWPTFQRLWNGTKHTTYASEVSETLSRMTGATEVSPDTLERLRSKITKVEDLDAFFESLNIKAVIVDPWWWGSREIKVFLEGKTKIPRCFKMVIPLPFFHFHPGESSNLRVRNFSWIQEVAGLSGSYVTSFDQFLKVVEKTLTGLKRSGAVAIKDQSAYFRTLKYDMVTRDEAERLFNKCLDDPNNSLGWPEAKPLDDFLFHEYMRFASKLELPVQVHTGHLAGQWNRVDKTSASLLTNVLELHKEVNFDLFHGNWPNMGDILFIAKNYPNVCLNLCWLHGMDPTFTVEFLTRAVQVIPHFKIMGFGGDYLYPEQVETHLSLARRNISFALSNLIDEGWLSTNDSKEIATDWLYNNPNRFYKLGLKEIKS